MWTTLKFRAKANNRLDDIPRVTQIRIQGYLARTVDLSAKRVKMILDLLDIKSTGVASLPRQRTLYVCVTSLRVLTFQNVLKNPHKWKKHQELWEMRAHTRVLTMEASVKTTRQVVDFILEKGVHAGTEVRLRRLAFEPLDKWWKNPYLHLGYYPLTHNLTDLVEIDRAGRLEKIRESQVNKQNWAGAEKAISLKGSVLHLTKDGQLQTVVAPVSVSTFLPYVLTCP
jgi:ribosomal protein S10